MQAKQLLILLAIVATLVNTSCSEKQMSFTLVNDSRYDQPDASAVISRRALESITGSIPAGMHLNLEDELGNVIPYQLDDMDGNGDWDELFLVTDLEANSEKSVLISLSDVRPEFITRTNIRFARIDDPENELTSEQRLETTDSPTSSANYQFEGPGWENDLIGFRNYYDRRNGIDIFGKKTSAMVLDEVDRDESVSYHDMQEWGMDILKVGNSLGAGSLAFLYNDSLYRAGDSGEGDFRMVTEGPLRSAFVFTFHNWVCGDQRIELDHLITIQAGKKWYKSTVTARNFTGENHLVSGIVNLHSDTLFVQKEGAMIWLATHDAQAELDMYLGMALIIPSDFFMETDQAPEEGQGITQTYYATMDLQENRSRSFYFYADWEGRNSQVRSLNYFLDELDTEARRLANPVMIK